MLNKSTNWDWKGVRADLQQVELNPALHVHDLVLPPAHLLALEVRVSQDRLDALHPAQVGEQAHLQGEGGSQTMCQTIGGLPLTELEQVCKKGLRECCGLASLDFLMKIFWIRK